MLWTLDSSIPSIIHMAKLDAPSPSQHATRSMLIDGLVNPHLLALVARIRHTNMLVIADAAFPFWPEIETVDISLVKGAPTVPQVVEPLLANWKCG